MPTEVEVILLIVALFIWSVASGIFGLVSIRKIRGEVYAVGNSFIDGLEEMFTQPTVKKAFTILGKQGGDQHGENLLVDSMAKDMLDTPQFAAVRMGASTLGFDLDEYIEKHGAVKTLQAASQLGKLVGIDITNIDLGKIIGGATGGVSTGEHPYLRR